uniref:CRISPR-associated endoribonuclease Cas2 n=1 Tax=Desulfacinum infernum TaxID=35837 RepID=A0A831ZS98_9BACT
MGKENLHVVCYDVVDDRRRQRVADVLKDFGARVQKSVFECVLDATRRRRLENRLSRLIDKNTDSILIYALCAACVDRKSSLGLAQTGMPESVKIL